MNSYQTIVSGLYFFFFLLGFPIATGI